MRLIHLPANGREQAKCSITLAAYNSILCTVLACETKPAGLKNIHPWPSSYGSSDSTATVSFTRPGSGVRRLMQQLFTLVR